MKCKKKNYGFTPFSKIVKLGYSRRRQYMKAMALIAKSYYSLCV